MKTTLKYFIAANAAVFTLLAAPAVIDHFVSPDFGMMPAAWAEDGPKGPGGPTGDKGHKGQGGPAHEIGGKGKGQAGPSADSDAKGPRYMGGSNTHKPPVGTRGGKPAWAQDGLLYDGQTAELGRLNVARAPDQVFDRQLTEALKTLDLDATSLYKVSDLQTAIAKILAEDPSYVRVDSPLQNLALLKCLLEDNAIGPTSAPVLSVTDGQSFLTVAALLLGSAADKTIAIEPATVYAITKIIEKQEPTLPFGVTIEQLAAAADDVREAVLYAHDN